MRGEVCLDLDGTSGPLQPGDTGVTVHISAIVDAERFVTPSLRLDGVVCHPERCPYNASLSEIDPTQPVPWEIVRPTSASDQKKRP